VRFVSDGICGGKDSSSDHNIVNFKIVSVNNGKGKMNYTAVLYITNQQDYQTFDTSLTSNFISIIICIKRRTHIN